MHEWHDSTDGKQHNSNTQHNRIVSSPELPVPEKVRKKKKKGWEGELASGLIESTDDDYSLVSWWPRRVEVAFIWFW